MAIIYIIEHWRVGHLIIRQITDDILLLTCIVNIPNQYFQNHWHIIFVDFLKFICFIYIISSDCSPMIIPTPPNKQTCLSANMYIIIFYPDKVIRVETRFSPIPIQIHSKKYIMYFLFQLCIYIKLHFTFTRVNAFSCYRDMTSLLIISPPKSGISLPITPHPIHHVTATQVDLHDLHIISWQNIIMPG